MSTLFPAHAVAAHNDLPILLLAALPGVVVVVGSILLVWPRAVRADDGNADVPDGVPDAGLNVPMTVVSLAVLFLLGLGGLLGSNEFAENILPTVFRRLVWIVVPLSCGLLGDWTRAVNPYANLIRLVDRPGLRRAVLARGEPLSYPRWLGWWPAVLLFFVMACAELIFNLSASQPRIIALGLVLYAVLTAFCGLFFGQAWIQHGEVFSVLFSLWGRLGFFRFAALGRRGFAGGFSHRHVGSRAAGEDTARASGYAWLVAMVAYTAFPLLLIAQGLVQESNAGQSAALGQQSQVTQQPGTTHDHGISADLPGMTHEHSSGDSPGKTHDHATIAATQDRPLGPVLGVFGGASSAVLLSAGLLRRKDRARARARQVARHR